MMKKKRKPRRVNWTRLGVLAGLAACALAFATGSGIASNSNPTPKDLFLEKQAAERSAAEAAPRASKVTDPTTPIAAAAKPERQAGILEIRQGPVSSLEFAVVNTWQGPVPGSGAVWYVVWAGSTGSNSPNPGTPGVIVHKQELTSDGYSTVDTVVGTFADATADGPLSIVSVTGFLVSMSSAAGHLYQFHLDTYQFT
jgi:hypothetical protein